MSNSILLNCLLRVFKHFESYYENSKLHKLFLKIDSYFEKWCAGSILPKTFISPCRTSVIENSRLYVFFNKLCVCIRKNNMTYVKWILNSKIFGLIFSILPKIEKCPFRLIGLFGLGFMTVNIIIGLMIKGFGTSVFVKLVLLCGFIILSTINISLKKALHGSYFFKSFKKLVLDK